MSGESATHDPFARLASTYEDWFSAPLGAFVDRVELAALDSLLPPPGSGRIVEVGAGTGHIARHLAARGFRVVAIEPSSPMWLEGQRRTQGLAVEWCAGVAEALPLGSDKIDGVLMFATLEFVRAPDLALREGLRVARPGGWVAVALLHALSPWAALYRALAKEGQDPWRAARFFTPEKVAELVGSPAAATAEAVHLAPGAASPYEEADQAGQRAGNAPALQLLLWRKSS